MHVDVIATIIDVNSYIVRVLSCQALQNLIRFFYFTHVPIERGQVAESCYVFWISFEHLVEALFCVYEIIDVLISETLVVDDWASIVVIFGLVVAGEGIAELSIIEEVVSVLLETDSHLYFYILVDRSLAEHISKTVYGWLILFHVHVDSPH